eukprot:Platyproteum_vivax@DN1757_c0_g1_i2.p1
MLDENSQNQRVYIGNLAWSTKWEDLMEHVSSAGKVSQAEIFKEDTGRPVGCAIVEFETEEEAKKCIDTLHDTELLGRKIFVREDREPKRGPTGRRGISAPQLRGSFNFRGRGRGAQRAGRTNFYGSRPPPARPDDRGRQVFVGNLAWGVSWQDLKDEFRACGEVIRADILLYPDGSSKGVGTVLFESEEAASEAVATFNNRLFQGRMLVVKFDKFV